MAKRRDWHLGIQYKQYTVTLFELKWWHPIPDSIGWAGLELGARIHFFPWLGEKISSVGQWGYRMADKAEVEKFTLKITPEQAKEIAPDFVSIFED